MIGFRDYLAERAMNSKVFADVKERLGDTAKVGFEFELIVPSHSTLYDNGEDDNRESELIRDYTDLDDYSNTFNIYRTDKSKIHRDYDDWVESAKDDWEEDNYENYMDDDEDEDTAREKARASFPDEDFTFKDWIESAHSTPVDFVNYYDLEPKYGWETPTGKWAAVYVEEQKETYAASAQHVRSTLQMALDDARFEIFDTYHNDVKRNGVWYIEPDGSIEGDSSEDHGLEVVSPPEPLKKALDSMSKVFKWMKKYNIETNKSTGLHINISIPDIDVKLDPLKLVVFMGEKYAAELFNRANNHFAKPQIQSIINAIKKDGRLPDDAKHFKETAYRYLSMQKYASVNISKLGQGYVEFRVAGGENYHYDAGQVHDTVMRFVSAVELACNPEEEKQEYMKKIAKLFDKAKDYNDANSGTDMQTFPKELRRIYILNKEIAKSYNRFERWGKPELLVEFAQQLIEVASNFKTSLDAKEIVYMKQMFKKHGVSNAVVDKTLHNENERETFKRAYKI